MNKRTRYSVGLLIIITVVIVLTQSGQHGQILSLFS